MTTVYPGAAVELQITKPQRCLPPRATSAPVGKGLLVWGHREKYGGQLRSLGARDLGIGEEETLSLSRVLGLGI